MKTITLIIAAAFTLLHVRAQDPGGSYNPFVAQGTISPAPLLPLENNGAGVITFKVGNTGSDPLVWDVSKPNNDMLLVISLSRGVPNIQPLNSITALATISGSYASRFSWVYDEFANTFYGRQNQTIPGLDLMNSTNEGWISIQYKTTQNSSQSGPRNGFNLNITPPPYAGSNAVDDDNVSSYTWTEIRDYGDAPLSYGSADHVIDAVNIIYLGSLVDGELANQSSVMANGDDIAGMDDEDGIVFPLMMAGTTVAIPVKTYGGGWLNAWIDWNADGDFDDVNEKISNNLYFTSGTNNLSVSVPQNSVTTVPTFARFRFGPSGISSSGSAAFGEVEDYMVSILCAPLAPPVVGLITQPGCTSATGSVLLSGLPPVGMWTLTRTPGGAITTGTGTSYTVNNLYAGNYTFSVSNSEGCNSTTSATVVINTQPATPSVPVISSVAQPFCGVATGTIALAGLPATGSWILTNIFGGETLTGSGTVITLIDLSAGIYSYTVTNAEGCTSPATAQVVIQVAPAPATAPVIGTITQPTCLLATGSVQLTGLPAGTWTINPGAITGSTTSITLSGLVAGTYAYTVTNSAGCLSPVSSNVLINVQPATPTALVISTITQPTCLVATGSVLLSGLPAGNWTINPGAITGSTVSKTLSGLVAGTYNYTITNAAGCTSPVSASVVILAQPAIPTAPVLGAITQPTCSLATGSVVLSGLPAGNWTLNPGAITGSTASTTLSGLVAGTYNYTVTNAAGCTSPVSASVVILAQPVIPTAPVLGAITQPTCSLATGSVVLSGLPAGNWTLNPGAITGSTASKTISGLVAGTYNYTVTNAAGCTSPLSASVVILAQPAIPTAPVLGAITQPTCSLATGSVVLSGLPAGNWTLNPGAITGSTASTTLSGLVAGTYNYTVTNAAGCTSPVSASIVINASPGSPAAPVLGTITQPTCSLATGSVVLSGLPAGNWTLNPGAITGSTASKTLSGLVAGTYNYTVTNAAGCTSPLSASVVILAQPAIPSAPVLGAITQPTCSLATGSLVLSGLPAGNWTLNPGAITGSTASTTLSGLVAGTYNYTVTNAAGCTSPVSASVVILAQPAIPTAPVLGAITQPTCSLATGSVVLSGLPAGNWTLNPGAITGSTTSTTLSGLATGTYAYTVTNTAGCISPASVSVVINTQPAVPPVPTGILTQPDCFVSTGTISISSPAGPSLQYNINGGTWQSSATFSGLAAGATYVVSVRNTAGDPTCVSAASFVINPAVTCMPVANDDLSAGNTPGTTVSLNLLANDLVSDGTPATPAAVSADLDPLTPGILTVLAVAGEGTWNYDPATGLVRFSPLPGFINDPAPIVYKLTQISSGMSDTAVVTIQYNKVSSLQIVKTVDKPTISAPAILNYTIVVSNTGNAVLTQVVVSDPLVSAGPLTLVSGDTNQDGKLDLTETWRYTATYQATQTMIDSGASIDNAATVSCSGAISPATTHALTTITRSPSLTLVKESAETSYSAAGSLLHYTITVRNTGNVSISSLAVTDPGSDPGSVTYKSGDLYSDGKMEPAETWVFGATHTVTQSDLDAGHYTNTATVTGIPAGGTLNPASGSKTVNGTVADLSIHKSGAPDPVVAGELITWSIQVTNPGGMDALGVVINDAVPASVLNPEFSTDGTSSWKPWVNPYVPGSIAARSNIIIWIRGTVKADFPANTLLSNTATVTSTTKDPDLTNNTTTCQSNVRALADLTITKVGTPNPIFAGQVITYNLLITNNGSSHALAVSVADPVPATILNPQFSTDGGVVWNPWVGPYNYGTLNAKSAFSFLIRGTVKADLPQGYTLINTATVSSSTPDPNLANNAASDLTIITVPNANLAISITVLEPTYTAVGDVLHYKIRVVNTSSRTLYNLIVTNPNGIITSGSPIASLAPGAAAEVLAIHYVTQACIDAGIVVNSATVVGADLQGGVITETCQTVVSSAQQRPQLTATKFSAETAYWKVGETIHYTIEVFNCGNVTIKNIVTSDPNASITNGSPIASLAPRATVLVTAEHLITQADMDAGSLPNIATVSGIDPAGKPVGDESNEVRLFANKTAQLTVTMLAKETSFHALGDTIHFSIVVKNYRNTVMSDIAVADGNAVITGVNPIYRLESGHTTTLGAYHIVNQADLNAGKVINVATARGTDYYGFIDRATSNEVTVYAGQSPLLSLTKTVKESTYSSIGELIHYSHEIRNTGNVVITGLVFNDLNTTVSGSNRIASLDPGSSVTIETVQTVSQSDLNAGIIEKTASISGNDPTSQQIRVFSNPVIIKATLQAQLEAVLTAAEISYSLPGDIIHYAVEVRNTGNVTLTNLRFTDPNAQYTKGNPVTAILPGSGATVTGEYLVTQADLLAGKVTSSVTANGYLPDGRPLSKTSNTVTIQANKADGLAVNQVVQEAGYRKAGDLVHYTITVKNYGKVPVSKIAVASANSVITGNQILGLVPAGGSVSVAALHLVTQADLDAGRIISVASISGNWPDGSAIRESGNQTTIYAFRDPQIITTLTATETSYKSAGEQIHYTIEVSNTGNLTVSDISLIGTEDLTITDGSAVHLMPGESTKISGVYTVTLADLDAGKVIRAVQASGKTTGHQTVSATGKELTVMGLQNPMLSTLSKATEASFSQVGEVIHYTIRVKNAGNVTIVSAAVTDPNAVIITARPITTLKPGQSADILAYRRVKQSDLNAGRIVSTATSAGFDLKGNTIEKKGNTVIVNALQNDDLTVINTPSGTSFAKVGEVIGYNLLVRNSGNVTLFNITVADPVLLMKSLAPIDSLQPGEAVSVTGSHTVTQDDMNAGKVVSYVKASGTSVSGKPVEKLGDIVTVNGIQQPALTVTATSSVSVYKKEGDRILYTLVITNTGNVTMNEVYCTDEKSLLDFNRSIGSLSPGETDSVAVVLTVTDAHLKAGRIVTAGIAHGFAPTTGKSSFMSGEITVNLVIENYNLGNFPNPFAYETTIVFDLPEKGEVILKVYDVAGREVGEIGKREYEAGRNFVKWNTRDAQKGVYFLKMLYNGNVAVKTMEMIN